jgi:hypothetical protein
MNKSNRDLSGQVPSRARELIIQVQAVIILRGRRRDAAALKSRGVRRKCGCRPHRTPTHGGPRLRTMGATYKREKRSRKLAHLTALREACDELRVVLPSDLTDATLLRTGFKRLGKVRGDLIEAALDQGVDLELLYETARKHSHIPQPVILRKKRTDSRMERTKKRLAVLST